MVSLPTWLRSTMSFGAWSCPPVSQLSSSATSRRAAHSRDRDLTWSPAFVLLVGLVFWTIRRRRTVAAIDQVNEPLAS